MVTKILTSILLLTILAITGSAQDPTPTPRQISGGVLNGKATFLPKPEYPPQARSISGIVNVEVVLSTDGSVISAKAVSGPDLLRSSAEAAARNALFAPTTLSGQPVTVKGVITYNFVGVEPDEASEIMAIGWMLYTVRTFAGDLQKFNNLLESEDGIKEMVDDVPEFPELKALLTIKDLPIDRRVSVIDGVIEEIKKNHVGKRTWSFQMGKALGEIFAELGKIVDEDDTVLIKLDEPKIRASLTEIERLIKEFPDGLSEDIRRELSKFPSYLERKELKDEEVITELLGQILRLIEAIDPSSDENE